MTVKVGKDTPTSVLLDIQPGVAITNGNHISGVVTALEVTDTDEFWLFIYYLEDGRQLEIKKVKNIC